MDRISVPTQFSIFCIFFATLFQSIYAYAECPTPPFSDIQNIFRSMTMLAEDNRHCPTEIMKQIVKDRDGFGIDNISGYPLGSTCAQLIQNVGPNRSLSSVELEGRLSQDADVSHRPTIFISRDACDKYSGPQGFNLSEVEKKRVVSEYYADASMLDSIRHGLVDRIAAIDSRLGRSGRFAHELPECQKSNEWDLQPWCAKLNQQCSGSPAAAKKNLELAQAKRKIAMKVIDDREYDLENRKSTDTVEALDAARANVRAMFPTADELAHDRHELVDLLKNSEGLSKKLDANEVTPDTIQKFASPFFSQSWIPDHTSGSPQNNQTKNLMYIESVCANARGLQKAAQSIGVNFLSQANFLLTTASTVNPEFRVPAAVGSVAMATLSAVSAKSACTPPFKMTLQPGQFSATSKQPLCQKALEPSLDWDDGTGLCQQKLVELGLNVVNVAGVGQMIVKEASLSAKALAAESDLAVGESSGHKEVEIETPAPVTAVAKLPPTHAELYHEVVANAQPLTAESVNAPALEGAIARYAKYEAKNGRPMPKIVYSENLPIESDVGVQPPTDQDSQMHYFNEGEIRTDEPPVIIANQKENGRNGAIVLGYLNDGTPVAIKRNISLTGKPWNIGKEEAENANHLNSYGINGRSFLGATKNAQGGPKELVFKILTGGIDISQPGNAQTMQDVETIIAQLKKKGVAHPTDIQFLRNKEGRVLVLDEVHSAQNPTPSAAILRKQNLLSLSPQEGKNYLAYLKHADESGYKDLLAQLQRSSETAGESLEKSRSHELLKSQGLNVNP